MPFNANNTTQPPFQPGCMTLTNDEVIKVQDKCAELEATFEPNDFQPVINDNWIIARYNESNNYTEAVNGDTYNVIKGYNRDVNTQGIGQDAEGNGIIIPEPEQPTEEPTEEAPVEEQPVEQPTEEKEPTEEV
ncbi:hypothetical protein CPT_Stills41 [Bacillus phage Stills]|uniref:Uncharacterized protein n=1 Tax=Bacillus phage Stills TaxID=1610833 RepID=A0A0E3T6B1_9CAUD|nr:hypothetical protein CPT_Stills41 [Bacillus phage Stills]AKC02669.1 hypothetical protein CPT_Stills41 [Bacillus phage Stills]